MPKEKEQTAAVVAETKTIEEWAAELQTPAWAFAGLKVRQNWAAGKVVTREEYERALRSFLGGPMSR